MLCNELHICSLQRACVFSPPESKANRTMAKKDKERVLSGIILLLHYNLVPCQMSRMHSIQFKVFSETQLGGTRLCKL